MSITRKAFYVFAFSTSLSAVFTVAASAQDAAAVADRFKAMLEKQGVMLSWSGVTGDASSMTMEGTKFTVGGAKEPAEIGKITFEGIKDDNGGYLIDKVSSEPFTKTQDGMTVELSPVEFSGVRIPAEASTDPIAAFIFYSGMKIDNFAVKKGDKTAFQMSHLSGTVTPPADDKAMEFKVNAEKFTGDLTLVDDPQAQATINALGYQQIAGNLDMAGSWNPKDGKMSVAQYDITVDHAGTFGMTFDFGGYTPSFIKSLQEMQKKMASQPAGADNSAQGMAMLGLMQQLTFESASIRWDDDSLTDKVIEFVAKQQNMQPADIKNQAKAVVPFLTGQLNNPELAKQISDAVNAYMDKPKSLEITAEPSAPVPFAQLAAGGMSNPIELTKTLGVGIKANQD